MGRLSGSRLMAGVCLLCFFVPLAAFAEEPDAGWERGSISGDGISIEAEQEELDEEYTSTELNQGIFAFRCDRYVTFGGTVSVVLQEACGKQISIEMNQENLYERNQAAASGSYKIVSAEAEWMGNDYQVDVPEQSFGMSAGQHVLVPLKLTEGTAEPVQKMEGEDTETEGDREGQAEPLGEKMRGSEAAGTKTGIEAEEVSGLMDRDLKPLLFIGAVLAVWRFGYAVYKRKHSRYA